VVNFIPARLTALLVIVAAFILRLDYANAYKILKRDKGNHSSPNSPYSEAPAAGALRIQLGGRAWYFGEMSMKPTMGDPLEEPKVQHIKKASHLMYTTSFLGLICATIAGLL
jgi:adenosylcobinamide-phosphate synthase